MSNSSPRSRSKRAVLKATNETAHVCAHALPGFLIALLSESDVSSGPADQDCHAVAERFRKRLMSATRRLEVLLHSAEKYLARIGERRVEYCGCAALNWHLAVLKAAGTLCHSDPDPSRSLPEGRFLSISRESIAEFVVSLEDPHAGKWIHRHLDREFRAALHWGEPGRYRGIIETQPETRHIGSAQADAEYLLECFWNFLDDCDVPPAADERLDIPRIVREFFVGFASAVAVARRSWAALPADLRGRNVFYSVLRFGRKVLARMHQAVADSSDHTRIDARNAFVILEALRPLREERVKLSKTLEEETDRLLIAAYSN